MRRIRVSILLIFSLFCDRKVLAGCNYTFGGWEFMEVSHDFKYSNFFGSVYFEHDNYEYKHLECWYVRTTVGYKVCDW